MTAERSDECPFKVGDTIRERQRNARQRIVTYIREGEYIVTMCGPRRSRISWKNLHRYRCVR